MRSPGSRPPRSNVCRVTFSRAAAAQAGEPYCDAADRLRGCVGPLVGDPIAVVSDPVTFVGGPVAPVGDFLARICSTVALIGDPVALVGVLLAFVGVVVTAIRDPVALVGTDFAPIHRRSELALRFALGVRGCAAPCRTGSFAGAGCTVASGIASKRCLDRTMQRGVCALGIRGGALNLGFSLTPRPRP